MVKPHNALLLACLVIGPVSGAIWPEKLGPATRVSAKSISVADKLWAEYVLQEAEQAEYSSDTLKFIALGYRLQDSTAALGAFEWQRPKDSKQSSIGKLAVETPDGLAVAHGNYLLTFQGYKPTVPQFEALFQTLPKLDQSPLPALRDYLPSDGLIANSERYVTGPVGLADFEPAIPAAAAGFHLGAEAQIATFHPNGKQAGGELKLAIFSYPTPNIARDRLAELQKLPGAVAKRSGPLVAVILSPSNANDAEWLLSLVKYQATVSWDQYVPTRRDNIGDLIVNAFTLIGFLLAFATVAGFAFGGFRAFNRRKGRPDPDAMTVLRLHDR